LYVPAQESYVMQKSHRDSCLILDIDRSTSWFFLSQAVDCFYIPSFFEKTISLPYLLDASRTSSLYYIMQSHYWRSDPFFRISVMRIFVLEQNMYFINEQICKTAQKLSSRKPYIVFIRVAQCKM